MRAFFRWLLAIAFLLAGANHFRVPGFYVPMIPPWLPAPLLLVQISGVAEMLGGLGVLLPPVRRAAAWGLIVLLIAIFPANLHLALHGFGSAPAWILWLRLPFQPLFIWWVWAVCLAQSPRREGLSTFP